MDLIRTPGPGAVAEAAAALRRGDLVAFPTETVYGLGAAARDPAAVARVFAAKGRPADHPLIVHLGDPSWVERWAAAPPEHAWRLAEAFWPGPLTVVLRRAPRVPDAVTGGAATIALRMPEHPVAAALLDAFGDGVAAPSANRFGRISPTTAQHVAEELGDAVAIILDGGPCRVGVESTIVDLTGRSPRILRPGGVSVEAVSDVLGLEVPVFSAGAAGGGGEPGPVFGGHARGAIEGPSRGEATGRGDEVPRAPGTMASHYAPTVAAVALPRERLAAAAGPRDAVLAFHDDPGAAASRWVALPPDPDAAARRLYAALRELDAAAPERILVELPPETPEWRTVRDRIVRATAPR